MKYDIIDPDDDSTVGTIQTAPFMINATDDLPAALRTVDADSTISDQPDDGSATTEDWVDPDEEVIARRIRAMAAAYGLEVQGRGTKTRTTAAEPSGTAAKILRSVPFLPNPDGGDVTISQDALKNWVAWVRAGRPDLSAAWNPALHPRGPDGKFVERPWDLPDSVIDDIDASSSGQLMRELSTSGELSDADLESLLQDDGIHVDGLPDDIDTVDELDQAIEEGRTGIGDDDGGDGVALEDIDPTDATQFVDPPAEPDEYDEGDIVQVQRDGSFEVARVVEPGMESDFEPLVENADGEQYRAIDGGAFVDGDIHGVYDPTDDSGASTLQDVPLNDARFREQDLNPNDMEEGDVVRVLDDAGNPSVGQITDRPPRHNRDMGVTLKDGSTVSADAFGQGDTLEFDGAFRPQEGFEGPAGATGVGVADFPDVDDVGPDDPRFALDTRKEVSEGDIVKISDENDDMVVGEITDTRFEGAEHTVQMNDGRELEMSLNNRDQDIVEAIPTDSPLFEIDPDDDDAADWVQSPFSADDGEFVRFRTPGDPWRMGLVDEPRNEEATLVTPDGETVPQSDVAAMEKFQTKVSDIDPESFFTGDDRDAVDLTAQSGDPADRREGVDMGEPVGDELPGEVVSAKAVPEGALLVKDTGNVYRVTGYSEDFRGNTKMDAVTEHGRERSMDADDFERRNLKRYRPRSEATVTIDGWGGEDDSLSQRVDAVRDTLDDVLPKVEDHREAMSIDGDLPITDDEFDRVKNEIAGHLARSRSKEHAETVIARMQAIGDEKSRASASPDLSPAEGFRSRFQIGEDDNDDTIIHELGHAVGYTYGFAGTSNDMDGSTYPMPEHKWRSPDFDAPEKYGLAAPPGERTDEDGTAVAYDESFFQLDDWTDQVEQEVGSGLDGRNFTDIDEDLGAADGKSMSEVGMIRLKDPPTRNGPQNWEVVDVEDASDIPDDDLEDEFGLRGPRGNEVVTLRSRDGQEVRASVNERLEGPTLFWEDDGPFIGGHRVDASRQSVPDDWRESPPDADDWIGEQSFDDHEEAARNLADKVNKAWYRQAAATREHGPKEAKKFRIKSGYSAKNAHETMSRVHEVMRRATGPEEQAKNLKTLVRYHPDLLEAYRNVYELSGSQKALLNGILDREGRDTRIGDQMPIGPQTDLLDDLYAEGDD